MTTNILLFLIVILLGYFAIRSILNYFNGFKNRYVNTGIQVGANKTVKAIMEKAKKGESFKLKDNQGEIRLKIVNKKNKK